MTDAPVAADAAVWDALIESYPYKPYRYYRTFPRKTQQAILRAEIAATASHADGVVVRAGDTALAAGRLLSWETAFFGVPMARLEYLLATTADARAQVLDDAIAQLRARGARHLSARVDVADIATLSLLEERGFRVRDALVTYITRPRKEPPHAVREVGRIREAGPADAEAIVAIAEEAYRGYRGRFHLDPHLPDERCDAFYIEWARQTAAFTMADTVLVAEGAEGRLLGFLGFRRREPVSSVGGTAVYGGGLGACRADAPGAYAGLIRAGTVWAHDRDGVAECQTQNYNFPTVRVYEAVGAHYVRGEYTLHAWMA